MVDAVVISDLHLGSANCQADALVAFLKDIKHGRLATRTLVLNGDLFDSIDFRRLNKHHWDVLSLLRKMSDRIGIVWITGNHDGPAESVSHLLGVEVRDEVIIRSGGEKILLLHGHRFDEFIDSHPWTTWAADGIYRLLQTLDTSHHFAKLAKKSSKVFLRCAKAIEERSVAYAKSLGCRAVCCGHTHHAASSRIDGVTYVNSGCWTEKPCHYLAIDDGRVTVMVYDPNCGDATDAVPDPERLEPAATF